MTTQTGVIIPADRETCPAAAAQIRAELEDRYPGVVFTIVAGATASAVFEFTPEPPYGTIDDGFGNEWVMCSFDCELEVVRPGKAQCNLCDETLDSDDRKVSR